MQASNSSVLPPTVLGFPIAVGRDVLAVDHEDSIEDVVAVAGDDDVMPAAVFHGNADARFHRVVSVKNLVV
jgi:hypothetical protein